MPIEIDPRFKASSKDARKRAQKRVIRRIVLACGAGVGLLVLAGLIYFVLPNRGDDTAQIETPETPTQSALDDDQLTMVEDAERPVFDARATFIDLRKDPLILSFAPEDEEFIGNVRPAPAGLDVVRIGAASPDQLTLIDDSLVVRSQRLNTTLPSTRADFAYFQSARGDAMALLQPDTPDTVEVAMLEEVEQGDLVTVDGEDGSWGALIPLVDTGTSEDEMTYIETTLENTTSFAHAVSSSDRYGLYQDEVIVIQARRPVADVLAEVGLGRVQATLTERAMTRLLRTGEALDPGMLLAVRLRQTPRGAQTLHVSLHSGSDHIGSIAQVSPGNFENSTDPWVEDDLLAESREVVQEAVQVKDIRLLDGIYSAAIRNGMPSTLVGEMMVMLSQHEDLDRFASPQDRFIAVMSTRPGITGQGAGQLLYAGITGPSGEIECYVVLSSNRENFECHREREATAQLGGIGSGLLVPVNGVKTSSFGPRRHPISGDMRAHNGVDWGAPMGTPVLAATDGTISRANFNGGYGRVIYIDHSGGRETRYAHLNAFADGIAPGVTVAAGDVIGYVGTTGNSTGPHLHFELRVRGNPVDPLTYTGPPSVTVTATTGSSAVEALVNRIIYVESANNPNAANPNSTARGLGQFIESTWLRMIDVYRPDLSGLSRADKLELRFDPDLSREMVRNLAREGESYLRNRGHQITAGRLYLAHFLGAQGAHVALSADPNASVASVMGQGVVNANGFLRGRNMQWLWNWADRKMVSSGGAPPPPVSDPTPQFEPVSPETLAYIEAIDKILDDL